MKKEVKNQGENTDNTKKPDVIERHPDSEILYIGCKDELAVELIKSVLGEKFKIFVLNKAIFNTVTEKLISSHIKWQEDQKILEYTKNPEKMIECLKICHKVDQKIGDNRWFSLREFIDETNFTYKHAHATMDLLFAFGFVAKDREQNKYKIIADPRVKLKYVEDTEAELLSDLEKFKEIKKQIQDGVIKGLEDLELAKQKLGEALPAGETREQVGETLEEGQEPVELKVVQDEVDEFDVEKAATQTEPTKGDIAPQL